MITAKSLTNGTLTLIVDNGAQILTARNDNPKWDEILAAFKANDDNRLQSLVSLQAVVEEYTTGYLSVNATGVTYAGKPIHTVDAERVMAFLRDGLPYQPIANYIARKLLNPSARAIQEMYAFLEHKGMPLTPKGTFIAYKGVDTDFWSIRGNKETVVLQGQVNEEGKILNTVGAVIEVQRNSVSDDFRQACGPGLHVGSLEYARGWGRRVVLVEVDPADVVSVPEDCSCQKMRCCKYTVIGEYTGPMPDTYTDEFSPEPEDDICHLCGAEAGTCDCEEETCSECGCTEDDCTCEPCRYCGSTDCSCEWNKQESEAEAASEAPLCTCCEGSTCAGEPRPKESAREQLGLVVPATYLKMVKLVSEQLGVDEEQIKPESLLTDLGADSLDGVELVMGIEEEFNIEIPDEDAEKYGSLSFAEIVKYVESRLQLDATNASENDPHYNQGLSDGKRHQSIGKQANYLPGDVNGADSDSHRKYIEGYVKGYQHGR